MSTVPAEAPAAAASPESPSERHAGPSLPVQLTNLIGREREIAAVAELLGSNRLLTLTGPGGTGKTRLALELAARAGNRYAEELVWIELASLADGGAIAGRVGEALGVQEQAGTPPEGALLAALRARSVLLVLDNCEHVVDGSARLVEAVLQACPGVRVLATSREALGIAGEVAWLVPPLSLPPENGARTPEEIRQSEAVQLFIDRARAVLPGFSVSESNAEHVVQICRQLDGIPLAIELASSRLRSLPVEQIARRLGDRFRLLTSGSRTALPRHRTLRAAIDWSYDLLSEPERALLARLSVFAGSFTLEAAEEVCGFSAIDPIDVMDLLSDLVEKSLVDLVDRDAEARYRLLETTRQYAADRLEEMGAAGTVRDRHLAHLLDLVTSAEPNLTTPEYPRWVDRLGRDIDNLRQSLAWARATDPGAHLALAGRLGWFWYSSALLSEGRRWLEEALESAYAAEPGVDRARALLAVGIITALQGEPGVARPRLEECIALAGTLGEKRIEAHAHNYLGLCFVQEGREEGREVVERAIALFRELDDLYGLRPAYLLLGNLLLSRGAVDEAVAACEEGVAIAHRFGRSRELGVALQSLGTAVLHHGDVERAASLLRESLVALSRDRLHVFIARSVELLGIALARRGGAGDAARMIGAADGIRALVGATTFRIDRERVAPTIDGARAELGDTAFDAAFLEGRSMTVDAALAFATEDAVLAPASDAVSGTTASAPVTAAPAAARAPEVGPIPAHRLTVRALGPLEIEVDGVLLPPNVWRYAKPRELLLYLLCHPQGRTREEIGGALWPNAAPAQLKNSFHVTLHHLRKALGRPEWVEIDRVRYRLSGGEAGADFDAAVFEREMTGALRSARRSEPSPERIERALALYRGDFLEGEPMGEWHLEPRDRLLALYVEGLVALAGSLLADGRHADAAEWFERVVWKEDVHEEAYRGLMTSLARAGQRDRALRAYERLTALLDRELEEVPEPETTALSERIRRGEAV